MGRDAPELKSLEGALDLRDRILLAFEAAETEPDEAARDAWLTFVVVGAGPTGVEMAGQIAELGGHAARASTARSTRARRACCSSRRPTACSARSPDALGEGGGALVSLGVTPMLGTTVVDIDAESVEVQAADGSRSASPARTAVWAAGVTASPLAGLLAEPPVRRQTAPAGSPSGPT